MTGGGRIIALGGGDIAEADTRSIDEHIVAVAPGSDPEALFIPTASGDDEEYITTFTEYYTELGCTVHTLRLTDPDVTPAEARDAIERADIIYVGGGDTGYLVDHCRSMELVEPLRAHFETGGVLSGLSAGALCWFPFGLSDAIALEEQAYGPTAGFGFLPDLHLTVHADYERREHFRSYLTQRGATGVALSNCAALEFTTEFEWRVRRSSPNAFAYHIDPTGSPEVRPLTPGSELAPLTALT